MNDIEALIRNARYAGLVYLKTGIFSGVVSVLVKTDEELVLWADGQECFRVPLSAVEKVEFPWWYGFGGMRVTVAGTRYTLGFTPPARTEGQVPQALLNHHEALVATLRGMSRNPGVSLKLGATALRSRRKWKAALADVGQG